MVWIAELFQTLLKSALIADIADYLVEWHEDSVAVERKEGRG